MKINHSVNSVLLVSFVLPFLAINSYGQNNFSKLLSTKDSSYGYTANNPLKLKKGNQENSITNSIIFLKGLKTLDDQTLALLFRVSTPDPNYKEPAIRLHNRFTGLPISGKLGILDKYVFLTSVKKDTITLFVDIYNKGGLMLPVGVKYDPPK